MELVKLSKKGQITIPKNILKKIGISEEIPMLMETTADGAIVLRQAGVYPIELYTDKRIKEFEQADRITTEEQAKVETLLKKKKKK